MDRFKKTDAGFIMQGSILAIASIVSRILGLVYRVPLTAIIGKTGNDYYGTAFEIYNIILIISSFSLPLAVSKMVAQRMADGEVYNTKRVFRAALVFALVSGSIACLIVFFGADFFAGEVLKTPFSALALRVLAPVLFVVAILGVFRGFFQGLGTTVPSAISQIIEQIVNCIVSIVAAYILVGVGASVGTILGQSDIYRAAYGASGATLGTALGAVAALIFIFFLYFLYQKRFKKRLIKDHTKNRESMGRLFSVLLLTILPVLLSTTLYNLSGIIDQGLFKNLALSEGYSASQISEYWGVFTGQYRVLMNVPIAIASALAASTVPALATSFQRREKKKVRRQIRMAMRFIMVIAFPCTIGFMVLAFPIMQLLFHDAEASSGLMLMIGAVSVIFYSISTLSNGVLQGIDRMSIPVRNAAISLVLQAGLLYVLMEYLDLHIYAVVIANAFYALCMCVLNGWAVSKYTKTHFNLLRTYLIPLICSVVMGAGVYLSHYVLYYFLQNELIPVIVSIIIGMLLYFVFMIFLHGLTRKDLEHFPKGTVLIRFASMLKLM